MSNSVTTIDGSGRLVVPEGIREEAGIEPGMALEIRYQQGRIEIEPVDAMPKASHRASADRDDDLLRFLEREIWSQIPADILGTTLPKQEREQILGYGPRGV